MDGSQIGKRARNYAGVLQDARLSCFGLDPARRCRRSSHWS